MRGSNASLLQRRNLFDTLLPRNPLPERQAIGFELASTHQIPPADLQSYKSVSAPPPTAPCYPIVIAYLFVLLSLGA